ncbi:hypothetical protein ACFPOE_14745 [Caenimonas terrae]|uniref:GNAT family N-acetyltransferase n=1 Tax=Caenimonas terrae TaxID=696074 RepID=A0ABW0NI52_9BURK
MGTEGMQALTQAQAVAHYEAMDLRARPATLHPGYVAADASRDPRLLPTYLLYQAQGQRWLHSLHLTAIPGTDLKDASSPYGYGGPLSTSDDARFLAQAWQACSQWMVQQRVVVDYVRFHPVLGNERWYGGSASDNREVVVMDLQGADFALAYPPRLKQTLKKAQRAGLVYRETALAPHARSFGAYYRSAMADIEADPFFLFGDAYFELLAATGLATLGACQRAGDADGPWLAASVFLQGRGLREYHLAATTAQGREVGASSFLLHEAALAARALGVPRLYLGGGSNPRPDNSLLFFKSSYSGRRLLYRTGSSVFRAADYDELKRRFAADWSAHPERPIFYRKV